MKILADTCLVIDFLEKRHPYSRDAQKIFLLAAQEKIDIFIPASSITDIYYILHKSTHNDVKSIDLIKKLLSIVSVLDTSSLNVKSALDSNIKDFEDALLAETAKSNHMDMIITRNLKDFKNCTVHVTDPESFLSDYSQKFTDMSENNFY